MASTRHLPVLLAVVLLNYAAQIPYYLHQYYYPRHLPPSLIGSVLLAITFIWFLLGYLWYVRGRRYGMGLLLSFLVTQVLFYGHSVVLGLFTGGGAVAQLETPSPFLLAIFLIGDINFVAAIYYAWRLAKGMTAAKAIKGI